MRKDEKTCPECAETIKLDAALCKHCGSKFSPGDVAKHKKERTQDIVEAREKRVIKKIDNILLEEMGKESVSDLSEYEIRPYQIKAIAEESESFTGFGTEACKIP